MAETIDQPRYRRWVDASHGVDDIEPAMAPYIQGLGKIDAQLVQQDAAFNALSADERGTFEQSLKLTDRFTVSRLWVLGAYEVVCALDQRVHGSPPLLTKRQRERVRGTKRAFARVRMPLAKLEPASAHGSDYASAQPGSANISHLFRSTLS